MYIEKIKSLKEGIITESLKEKLISIINKITIYMTDFEKELKEKEYQDSYEFKVLVNDIFNYFYELSSSIFDTFVCEGGSEDYSYKSFKLFYMNIFYSFLQDFFIKNNTVKEFFSKLKPEQYQRIYAICEDSLFNFIAHYFFASESDHKDKIEHILKNIINYDCDSDDKLYRYKKILFSHYKESVCNEITSYNEKIKEKMSNIHKEIAGLRIIVKTLKTYYYDFNKEYGIKILLESGDNIPTYLFPVISSKMNKEEITKKSLWDNVKFFKLEINNKNKEYSELDKLYKTQLDKYEHAKNITQEDFEKGL